MFLASCTSSSLNEKSEVTKVEVKKNIDNVMDNSSNAKIEFSLTGDEQSMLIQINNITDPSAAQKIYFANNDGVVEKAAYDKAVELGVKF